MAEIRKFRRNFWLKVLAFGLALIVWTYFSVEPYVEKALEVGISYINVPVSLELNPDQADRVTLIIRGPRQRVRSAEPSQLTVEVDLAGFEEPAQQTFDITESALDLPDGVDLVRAVPSQLRLLLESHAEQEVAVHPNFTGTPAGGRELAAVRVDPARLKIAGPASRVRLVQHVTTDPIDLNELAGPQSFATKAYLPDPYLRFQTKSTVTVHVTTQ